MTWAPPLVSTRASGKSEVSRICAGLDESMEAFRSRPLHHTTFPYVFLDATYLHLRRTGQVTSMAVVVATGVTATGGREVLGVDVGDSEDEVFWRGFLRAEGTRAGWGQTGHLRQHAGVVGALGRMFQAVAHQRCRVHFVRNLVALVSKSHKDMVAAVFRTIFAQPDPATVAATWNTVRDRLAAAFPKIGHCWLRRSRGVGVHSVPAQPLGEGWSTNPLERVNRKLRTSPSRGHVSERGRREPASRRRPARHARRMATQQPRLRVQHSMAQLNPTSNTGPVAAIQGSD
jgi:putative transposase